MIYNEIDPSAATWLENLIDAGHLPKGKVDRRDIRELSPDDCHPTSHFFAGIGGWPLALKWAGFTGDVWTGSCPCQPFSAAGSRKGFADERHLWPTWFQLISKSRPPIVFGEQVAGESGGTWFAGVRADMEEIGYRVVAADLCAASVGSHQRRQRLFFGGVADGQDARHLIEEVQAQSDASKITPGRNGVPGWGFDVVMCSDRKRRPIEPGTWPLAHGVPKRVELMRGYGNAIVPQLGAIFIKSFMEAVAVS